MQTQAEQQAKANAKHAPPRAAMASNAIVLLAGILAAGIVGDAATAAAFVAGVVCALTAAYAVMIRM